MPNKPERPSLFLGVRSQSFAVEWLTDGDHSFKPRKASGRTERENWDEAIRIAAEFAARQHRR